MIKLDPERLKNTPIPTSASQGKPRIKLDFERLKNTSIPVSAPKRVAFNPEKLKNTNIVAETGTFLKENLPDAFSAAINPFKKLAVLATPIAEKIVYSPVGAAVAGELSGIEKGVTLGYGSGIENLIQQTPPLQKFPEQMGVGENFGQAIGMVAPIGEMSKVVEMVAPGVVRGISPVIQSIVKSMVTGAGYGLARRPEQESIDNRIKNANDDMLTFAAITGVGEAIGGAVNAFANRKYRIYKSMRQDVITALKNKNINEQYAPDIADTMINAKINEVGGWEKVTPSEVKEWAKKAQEVKPVEPVAPARVDVTPESKVPNTASVSEIAPVPSETVPEVAQPHKVVAYNAKDGLPILDMSPQKPPLTPEQLTAVKTAAGVVPPAPAAEPAPVFNPQKLAKTTVKAPETEKLPDWVVSPQKGENTPIEPKPARSGEVLGAIEKRPVGVQDIENRNKVQVEILKLAEIPKEKLPEYLQSSMADGAKLRDYTEEVMSGVMTKEQAAVSVKADYVKLTEKETPQQDIITDPHDVQEIKNSIADSELTLRTGKFNGRKLSPGELEMVERSLNYSRAKIGLIKKAAVEPEVMHAGARKPAWEMTKDEFFKHLEDTNKHAESVAAISGEPIEYFRATEGLEGADAALIQAEDGAGFTIRRNDGTSVYNKETRSDIFDNREAAWAAYWGEEVGAHKAVTPRTEESARGTLERDWDAERAPGPGEPTGKSAEIVTVQYDKNPIVPIDNVLMNTFISGKGRKSPQYKALQEIRKKEEKLLSGKRYTKPRVSLYDWNDDTVEKLGTMRNQEAYVVNLINKGKDIPPELMHHVGNLVNPRESIVDIDLETGKYFVNEEFKDAMAELDYDFYDSIDDYNKLPAQTAEIPPKNTVMTYSLEGGSKKIKKFVKLLDVYDDLRALVDTPSGQKETPYHMLDVVDEKSLSKSEKQEYAKLKDVTSSLNGEEGTLFSLDNVTGKTYTVKEGESKYYEKSILPNAEGGADIPEAPEAAIQNSPLKVKFRQKGYLKFPGEKISSPADVAYAFLQLKNEAIEKMFVVGTRNDVPVCVEPVSIGALTESIADPFEPLKLLIENKCDGCFIIHNHPSGNPRPSDEDIGLTNRYRRGYKDVGIEVKGHIVINHKQFAHIYPKQVTANYVNWDVDILPIPKKTANEVKVPVLEKYLKWLKPPDSNYELGPSSAEDMVRIIKSLNINPSSEFVMYLNPHLKLLASNYMPGMNVSRIIKEAVGVRSQQLILVNPRLEIEDLNALKIKLENVNIHILDELTIKDGGFYSRNSSSIVREAKPEYGFAREDSAKGWGRFEKGDIKPTLLNMARDLREKTRIDYKEAKAAEDEFFSKLGKVNVRFFKNREEWKTIPPEIKRKVYTSRDTAPDLDEAAEAIGMTDDQVLQKLQNMKLVKKPSYNLLEYVAEAREYIKGTPDLGADRAAILRDMSKAVKAKGMPKGELRALMGRLFNAERMNGLTNNELSLLKNEIEDVSVINYEGENLRKANKIKAHIHILGKDIGLNKDKLEQVYLEETGAHTTRRMTMNELEDVRNRLISEKGLGDYVDEWKLYGKKLPFGALRDEYEAAVASGDFEKAAGLLEKYLIYRPMGETPDMEPTLKAALKTFWKRWGTSGTTILRRMGNTGNKLAGDLERWRMESNITGGRYESVLSRLGLAELTAQENRSLLNALEGRTSLAGKKLQRIYKAINIIRRQVAQQAQAMKIVTKDEEGNVYYFAEKKNYFPHKIPPFRVLKDLENPVTKDIIKNIVNLGEAKDEKAAAEYLKEYIEYQRTMGADERFLYTWIEKGKARTLAEAKEQIDRVILPMKNKILGTLERARAADLPFYDPNPARVMPNWIEQTTRRMKQIEIFGQNNEKLYYEMEKLVDEGYDWKLAKRIFDNAFERLQADPQEKQMQLLFQDFTVITKMGLSAILQPSTAANIAAFGDMKSTLKGLGMALGGHGKEFAIRCGAISNTTMREVASMGMSRYTSRSESFLKKVGMIPLDRFMRSWAANSGKAYALQVFGRLKKSPSNPILTRELLKVIPDINIKDTLSRGYLNRNDILKAGNTFSTITQFAIRPENLPVAWRGNPNIELLLFLKSFSFSQARYVWNNVFRLSPKTASAETVPLETVEKLWKESGGKTSEFWDKIDETGNVTFRPKMREKMIALLKFMAAAGIMGEGISDIRSLLYLKKRPVNLIARYVDNLISIGMLGFVSDAIESMSYGKASLLQSILGPVYSDMLNALNSGYELAVKGKPKNLTKMAFDTLPYFAGRAAPGVAMVKKLIKPYIFPSGREKKPESENETEKLSRD